METTTLEDVLAGEPTANVVVKSNCEGAEVQVFRRVPAAVRQIIVSFHAWAPCSLDEFTAGLREQGFAISVLSRNSEHTNLFCRREPAPAGRP